MSLEPTAGNLIFCVREMADACCEIETPCPGLPARLGAEGVRALHELVVGEAETDDESVACFAVALLARFDHPAVVPALRGILGLSFRSATIREEVLEEVFNCAAGNRALLDPAFLADAPPPRRVADRGLSHRAARRVPRVGRARGSIAGPIRTDGCGAGDDPRGFLSRRRGGDGRS